MQGKASAIATGATGFAFVTQANTQGSFDLDLAFYVQGAVQSGQVAVTTVAAAREAEAAPRLARLASVRPSRPL
jgi:hypothetical protein